MSEVNNVNPFDHRVNASGDSKPQREDTVKEERKDSSKPKQHFPSKGQERRDSAVTEMIRAIQKQHKAENLREHQRNVQELYRQRNLQASEEYMKRMEDKVEDQGEELVDHRQQTEDVHESYNQRIKDISRDHIQRMLKNKLDKSTFKSVEKIIDPDAPEEDEDKNPKLFKKSTRTDQSRLRPEVSRLLSDRATEQSKAAEGKTAEKMGAESLKNTGTEKNAPAKPPSEAAAREPNYNLIENALSKLKGRLGGAFQNNTTQAEQAGRQLASDQLYAQKQPVSHAEAPIRANMGQIQKDIQRGQQLKASADGTRYVPLENKDIEQLLTRYKIPYHHATVQIIKHTSQKLQDSSYYFMRAASILAHTGLDVTPERAELVSEALRMYEKYERPSIMNKLFRYLVNSKYLQLYQTLDKPGSKTAAQGADLGRSLFDGQSGKALRGERSTFAPRAVNSASTQGPQGLQLPLGATEEALRSAVKAQLQDLGLPANRVMTRQIAQSANGDTLRAQALILQLASGGSLAAASVDPVHQKLLQLPPDQQQAGPLELMKLLKIPLPEKLQQLTSPEAQKLAPFLIKLGIPTTRLDAYPQARESLVHLQQLAQQTGSLEALQNHLGKALQARPDFFLKQLSLHTERIQTLSRQLTDPRFATPKQQQSLSRALVLAIEMPDTRMRAWERVRRTLGELSKTPLPQTAAPEKPLTQPEKIFQNYGPPRFALLPELQQQTRAREAVLLLHTQAERQGTLNVLQPALKALLSKGASALELLAQNLQQLQQSIHQGEKTTQLVKTLSQQLSAPLTKPSETLPQALLDAYPAFQKLPEAARAALTLLHAQAEHLQQLNTFIPRMNELLNQPQTAQKLMTQLPFIQQQTLSQPLNTEQLNTFVQALRAGTAQMAPTATAASNVALNATPNTAPNASANTSANASVPLPTTSPFLEVLNRFYPQLSGEARLGMVQQLQQASPDSLKGFFQLHQLLGQMDPMKVQSLANLWQQPQTASRLAALPTLLTPLFVNNPDGMARSYQMNNAQQNSFIQSLQTYVQNGKISGLKTPLAFMLQLPTHAPLGKIKEQLAALGLKDLTPTLLNQVWQQSQGSRQRIDAMGILLRGNLALSEKNIAQVVQFLNNLPAADRQTRWADLLLQLSGKLQEMPPLSLSQARVKNPLTQLRTLLQSDLPLLAKHFNPAQTATMPAQQVGLSLNTSPNQLLSLLQQLPAEGLLKDFVQQLQHFLKQLNGLIPTAEGITSRGALKNVQQALQQLLQTLPGQNLSGQNEPVATLMNAIQQLPGSEALPATRLAQIQQQLLGLFHELGMLLPALNKRLLNAQPMTESAPLTPAQTENAMALLAEGDMNAETVQKYLQQWGLQAQSPEQLQQIVQLMQGQQERLDAMAILLKGNMPLLPAHIQVVAQYVKKLPPQERFQSISKVLSFLSDDLISQMKKELRQEQSRSRSHSYPQLSEAEGEVATEHLRQQRGGLSEASYTAAAYQALLKPQNPNANLQHLLQYRHGPENWLLPLERMLGQLQSLFPRHGFPAALQDIQETLGHMKALLQPVEGQQGALSQWMQQIGGKMQSLDRQLQQQIRQLTTDQQLPYSEENWLDSLLQALMGVSEALEEDPQKSEQLRKLQHTIREQLQHFGQSLHSLEAFQQSQPQPLQYIPAYLSQLGLEVEVLIQPNSESDEESEATSGGKAYSEVLLNVKTHTLGDVQVQLRYDNVQKRLDARMGLSSGKLLRQIQPLLASFTQKMQKLPFEVGPLQTFIQQKDQQTVIAQRLYQRYGQKAIAKL